jgi:integrase
MPRRKRSEKPSRREQGTGSVVYVEKRRRWRARLPAPSAKESWHLTRDEAEAWIARELARADDSFDPSGTVGAYLDYYLGLQTGRIGEQTMVRYRGEANALGATIRAVRLERLRGDQALKAQADLLARGVSRIYAYNVMALLKRALDAAVRWKILAENVMDGQALPEPERRVTRAWSPDEARAVLAAIVGHRFEACYLLILWGGLRIGEVVALRWSDIADDGTVTFEQAEHTHIRGRPIGATKRERRRETQLPLHVVARLHELRDRGPQRAYGSAARPGAAYVYVAQRADGERWSPYSVRNDWKRLVAGLAVQPLRPHGGRRTTGTLHMVAGAALADVSALLGHSSPAITARSYIASDKERRREAAERLARMLEPRKPEKIIEEIRENSE